MVVGIERYQTPLAKTLQGPSLDALRFALWLCEVQKVPAGNIILIQNKSEWKGPGAETYNQTLDAVKAAGITVRESPSRLLIAETWRTELLSGPAEEGTLWLYWSGHGVTFPQNREAVLCANIEEGDPSYMFLGEFRDSLRNWTFKRFTRQRLIVDACAEYLSPEALNITSFRNPRTWAVTETPEQIELDAVAVGSTAEAEEGGSLFSRVLLRILEKKLWPSDPRELHSTLEKAIRAETDDASKLPRLRIISGRFEVGIDLGNHPEECRELLEILGKCEIPFESYQPFYLRTMGGLISDPQVLSATTLTGMIRELLELHREAEFGGRSLALVEFLARVTREFKEKAMPIAEWLMSVPAGGRLSVNDKLDKEASDLVLTIRLRESTSNAAANRDGYPVAIHADLSDANFLGTILSWDYSDLKDQASLETKARLILNASDAQARRQKGVSLRVQVFANPPLMGVPMHAFRMDPEDDDSDVFGRLHSFVLRSRARLARAAKYDLDAWSQKAKALRQRPCGDIAFERAPEWRDELKATLNDTLAQVDGLLLISDPLATPSLATEGLYKMLNAAMKRGVPLASWPVILPGDENNAPVAFDGDLKKLFKECGSLAQTPERFLYARKSQPWARHAALFWDDDDTDKLLNVTGEEPSQL